MKDTKNRKKVEKTYSSKYVQKHGKGRMLQEIICIKKINSSNQRNDYLSRIYLVYIPNPLVKPAPNPMVKPAIYEDPAIAVGEYFHPTREHGSQHVVMFS